MPPLYKNRKTDYRFYRTVISYLNEGFQPNDKEIACLLEDGLCSLETYKRRLTNSNSFVERVRATIYLPIKNYEEYTKNKKTYDQRLLEVCIEVIKHKTNHPLDTVNVAIRYLSLEKPNDSLQNDIIGSECIFHPSIMNNCLKLIKNEQYFYAVHEASKLYINLVKQRSGCANDGRKLMTDVFNKDHPLLKVSPCITDSEIDCQEGIMYLSMGLVGKFRNPTAHEPECTWDITKKECLEILHFISYMLNEVDHARFNGK